MLEASAKTGRRKDGFENKERAAFSADDNFSARPYLFNPRADFDEPFFYWYVLGHEESIGSMPRVQFEALSDE